MSPTATTTTIEASEPVKPTVVPVNGAAEPAEDGESDAEDDNVPTTNGVFSAYRLAQLSNETHWISNLLGEAKKKKKKKKTNKKKKVEQSEPPRVGLSKLFPSGIYPEGEIQEYKDECVLQYYQTRICCSYM
jgi:hypothetical protein